MVLGTLETVCPAAADEIHLPAELNAEASILISDVGGHSKIGELIGKAVYEGVIEAQGKQNTFRLRK